MRYDTPLFRPPSEAGSLILQATLGCSHNRCSFCSMYRSKRFSVRPAEVLRQEIHEAAEAMGSMVRRVFLADGDAMCLSTRRLLEILDPLDESFENLQRVGIYANARDVLRKSDEELRQLRARKLKIIYLGLESGDPETLEAIDKGATVEQMIEAVQRAEAADIRVSVMVLIGLGGRQRSSAHARHSASAINAMQPTYTALLTYTPTPGSPLHEAISSGAFELPTPIESVEEIRLFIEGLDCRTYFTCNHASNYLPLKGSLPGAKARLLEVIDSALADEIPLKPEFLRGL